MTQQATVRKILSETTAEVEVVRRGACGGDCAKCGGCEAMAVGKNVSIHVNNPIGALIGDTVTIEGETKKVLGFAALVYTLPVVLFFMGYVLFALLQKGEGIAALGGCVFAAIGVLIAIRYNRKMEQKNEISFTITGRI